MGHFPSALTVVSGLDSEGLIGFTCQSFFSVSLTPPLIAISVMRSSRSYPRLRETGGFAVSVLDAGQRGVATAFASGGEDKWWGVRWRPTAAGRPVIANALIWLDCQIWSEHDAGDHTIVVGEVVELGPPADLDVDPLVYLQGRYRALQPEGDSRADEDQRPDHEVDDESAQEPGQASTPPKHEGDRGR